MENSSFFFLGISEGKKSYMLNGKSQHWIATQEMCKEVLGTVATLVNQKILGISTLVNRIDL